VNRGAFRATLVFAEHRFWGESVPSKLDYTKMGPEQAIEDYVRILGALNRNRTMKVVAFGGSYGGMLAAWMRLTRPDVVDAAVASSAPVLAFPHPDHEASAQRGLFYGDFGASYWRVVARGHMAPCARRVFAVLSSPGLAASAVRRLGACPEGGRGGSAAGLTDDDVAAWAAFAFDNLAMGDYPFETNYISPGLPANPAAAACAAFARAELRTGSAVDGLRAALDVWYNASRSAPCHAVPKVWNVDFYAGRLWDTMWCLNALPQETYFTALGAPNDMFRPQAWTWADVDAHCEREFGRRPDRFAVHRLFGATTEREWVRRASRIVFSNGGLDPWSAGGLRYGAPHLPVVWIPSGAHHADLFFPHAADPLDLVKARQRVVAYLRAWLRGGAASDAAAQ